jgi:sugar phosphate isomerase/epimerase
MKRITYFIGFILIAGFMSVGLLSCETAQEDKFIGIQLWSVRGDMNADAEGTLRQLGEMGYSFIEAAGYQNGRFYGMDPVDFRALVEASGMKFLSSHVGRELPSEEGWDEAMQWWETAIDAHARAEVPYMIQPFMPRSAFDDLEVLDKWAHYFNEIGRMARDRGVRFGFHNHAIEFMEVDGVVAFDYLLENTDPDLVFYQLDLYWIVEGGKDAVDYFRRYPGRFLMYHVKDREEVGASGTMDFRPAFENAELAGMRYHIVEVEQYNYEPIESVRHSLDYLNNADYVQADYR